MKAWIRLSTVIIESSSFQGIRPTSSWRRALYNPDASDPVTWNAVERVGDSPVA